MRYLNLYVEVRLNPFVDPLKKALKKASKKSLKKVSKKDLKKGCCTIGLVEACLLDGEIRNSPRCIIHSIFRAQPSFY